MEIYSSITNVKLHTNILYVPFSESKLLSPNLTDKTELDKMYFYLTLEAEAASEGLHLKSSETRQED